MKRLEGCKNNGAGWWFGLEETVTRSRRHSRCTFSESFMHQNMGILKFLILLFCYFLFTVVISEILRWILQNCSWNFISSSWLHNIMEHFLGMLSARCEYMLYAYLWKPVALKYIKKLQNLFYKISQRTWEIITLEKL